ncbi:MAG: sigma-70 family RNA polymerase sigma factor [Planctomycetota bacterium]|nr:sigma-70 family RNA polymerase sigma factor [Planctomycetota bacterium]
MTEGDAIDDSNRGFDADLAAAKAGDRNSRNCLLETVQRYLESIAEDNTPDWLRPRFGPSSAVQETLITLDQRIEVFEGTVGGWHAYARVILINKIRRAIQENFDQIPGPIPEGDPADPNSGPLTAVVKKELRELLKSVESQMSPDHRLVLKLRKQELSFSEVGKQMRRSEDAARKLFGRAMADLEKRLYALDVLDSFKKDVPVHG